MASSLTNTLMLLGGAGLGAVTMFLLDPDKGQARRDRITSQAEHAAESAHDALHAKLSDAGQYAQQAVSDIRDRAKHAADDLSHQAHGIASQARRSAEDVINSARGTARGYADQANDYSAQATRQARTAHDRLREHLAARASSLFSQGRSAVREQVAPSHPYAVASGLSVGTVGLLAAGAGAMFLFDPARGSSRRAMLRDRLFSLTRRTGKSARQYGRHLGNLLKGAAHDLKGVADDAGKTAQDWATSTTDSVRNHMRTSSSSPTE
jgi:gas vesicle protein